MPVDKHALAEMTHAEFRARMAADPVILLPLGSQEEQGPHAPMGDYMISDRVAQRVARLAGAIHAPVLPFGHADFFRSLPGGIQLSAPVFEGVLHDMLTAFLDHGLTRLVILNGHTTNAPLIETVLRRVRRDTGVSVASIDLWRTIPDAVWTRVHGPDAARARGHGGDPITSLYAHLFPALLRPDLARPATRSTALGLPVTGVRGVRFEGQEVLLPLDAAEVNPDGMLGGDPALASAEAGAALFEHVTRFCAGFARHLATCDTRAPVTPADPA